MSSTATVWIGSAVGVGGPGSRYHPVRVKRCDGSSIAASFAERQSSGAGAGLAAPAPCSDLFGPITFRDRRAPNPTQERPGNDRRDEQQHTPPPAAQPEDHRGE